MEEPVAAKLLDVRPRAVWPAGNYANIGAVAQMLAAIRTFSTLVRRAQMWLRQQRHATETREALQGLDDRTLRDLGFHRDEIDSITAGLVGGSGDSTRVRRG